MTSTPTASCTSTRPDKATGREQNITITASSGLSKEEVDRMVKQAEQNRAEDQRRREEVEARNEADSAAYQVEKFITDTPNLPDGAKEELEGKIAAVRSAMQASDTARMNSSRDELMEAWQRVGAQMHQAAPEQPQAPFSDDGGSDTPPPPPPPADDENVVEGEFREA